MAYQAVRHLDTGTQRANVLTTNVHVGATERLKTLRVKVVQYGTVRYFYRDGAQQNENRVSDLHNAPYVCPENLVEKQCSTDSVSTLKTV